MMEYAVPMAVILMTAGVLATAMDLQGVLGDYFMAASGHTNASLTNGRFQTDEMASTASGNTSDGRQGFTSLGTITDGTGTAAVPQTAPTNTGNRATERLFDP